MQQELWQTARLRVLAYKVMDYQLGSERYYKRKLQFASIVHTHGGYDSSSLQRDIVTSYQVLYIHGLKEGHTSSDSPRELHAAIQPVEKIHFGRTDVRKPRIR